MTQAWAVRIARITITILPCLIYLALSGCSSSDPPTQAINLSRVAENGDSLAIELMVKSDHHRVRSELDSLIRNLIRSRASTPDSIYDSRSLCLKWLVSQYARITSIRDLSNRLSWAISLTKRNAAEKVRLDSILSSLGNRHPKKNDRVTGNELEALIGLYRDIGDSSQVASILLTLTHMGLGSLPTDSCLGIVVAGEELCRAADLGEILGDFLFSKSKILAERQGNYFESLAGTYESIACFERFGYRARIPRLRLQAGRNLLQLGLITQAVSQFRLIGTEYADLSFESNDRNALTNRAIASNLLAESFYDLAELDSALNYANKSVEAQNRLLARGDHNDSVSLAYSLSTRGIILQAKDSLGEAETDLNKAHTLFVEVRDKEGLATNSFRRAALLVDESRHAQAESLFDTVMQLSSDPQNRLFSQYGKALARYLEGDLQSAKQLAAGCIEDLEAERDLVLEPDLAVGFLSDKIGMYDLLITIYLRQYKEHANRSYLDSAFRNLERSKSRSLISILKRDRAEPRSGQGASVFLTSNRAAVSQEISYQVSVGDSLRISQLEQPRGHHAGEFGVKAAEQWHAPEVLPGHAYLDYFASEFGVGLFVIASDTICFMPIELTLDSLKILTEQFASAVSSYPRSSEPSDAIKKSAQELGRVLIPFEFLRANHVNSLSIVPTSPLDFISFSALKTPEGNYLVEEFEISSVPSIEVAQVLASRRNETRSPLRLVALGDPVIDSLAVENVSLYFGRFADLRPLNFAREELLAIESIYSDADFKLLLQGETSKASLASQLATGVSVLHFATHGLVNSENPEFSALLLSSNLPARLDGLLKAAEIEELQLEGMTVFLSACETASGTQYRGEGVYSLARSFLSAGANEVIATLWNVDDRSTVEITREFYTSLHVQVPATGALARAQRAMINSPRRLYRHPYFWSPFVHIGNSSEAGR